MRFCVKFQTSLVLQLRQYFPALFKLTAWHPQSLSEYARAADLPFA